MKTILITGGNSFLAKEFINFFTDYNLIVTDRNTLDVTNKQQVDNFFINNKIDYVFHTAVKGGSRLREDTFQDFVDNLTMYNNLANNCNKFELMFNFGSGAEFARDRSIDSFQEEKIFERIPNDFYGCSKNLICRDIISKNNLINIRLFGCFGILENDTRFIKSTIKKSLTGEDIIINIKEMDFFFIEDLVILIKNLLNGKILYKNINAVYKEKKDLFYIAEQIKTFTNSKSRVIISVKDKNYTGCSKRIDTLNLNFLGLENSIKKIVEQTDVNKLLT